MTEGYPLTGQLGPAFVSALEHELTELGMDNTGAEFFNHYAPSVYLEVEYGSADLPKGTQSGFAILDATTGQAVVRHTPAFLIGEYAPMSKLIVEHIAHAIGIPDLNEKLLKATRTDFTADTAKYLSRDVFGSL